jgi:CheY-like chemotaxis protein
MESKQTVLLVEDETNDVFMMRRTLRKMNAPVSLQVTKDGVEAIEYLSGANEFAHRDLYPLPSLILLDIKMPRKNGFDVLEWLKEDGTLLHIPVVMVTSSNMKSDVDKALELGARAYLLKPVPFEDLQQLVTATEEFLSVHAT